MVEILLYLNRNLKLAVETSVAPTYPVYHGDPTSNVMCLSNTYFFGILITIMISYILVYIINEEQLCSHPWLTTLNYCTQIRKLILICSRVIFVLLRRFLIIWLAVEESYSTKFDWLEIMWMKIIYQKEYVKMGRQNEYVKML